jgi:dipeptidyl-peptidase 4
MRHTLPALLCALSLAAVAAAQAPKKDAPLDTSYLKDHAETRGFMLGRPVSPKPTPDGKAVLFLRSGARVPKLSLFEFDVATGKTRELLTPEQVLKGALEHLTAEEKARRERMRVTVGGFTSFQLSEDGERILVSLSGKLYVVKRADGSVQELPAGEGIVLDPKFSPDGHSVGYVRDNDVYVIHLNEGKERPATKGGSEKKTHGLAEFVAQEEMGRFTGWWWSPDGKQLAYEEADADGVEVWYVADPIHPERPPQPTFYPRPGKANVSVRLGVVGVPTGEGGVGETVWLDWDAKRYPYLGTVRWDKHGPLSLVVQARDQKEQAFLTADPATGKTNRQRLEQDPVWVNLSQDCPRWMEDGKAYLWQDQAPGLILEKPTLLGGEVTYLATAAEGYQGLVDFNPKTGTVVYRASTDPTQSQLYRRRPTGKPEPLTRDPGVHNAVFSKDHSVYVLQSVTADAMPKTTVHQADGTLLGELPSVAEDPPFVPRAETVKVGDGEGFYAYVIRPHGFDPKKKYPVIDYVYGGPHHLQVQAAMNTRLLPQWLADQGFIVVSLDNRGTPGRGHDFERAVGKHFGSVPLEDQVAGVKALCKKFPEMDADRVGVYGWSFGGYLAALAVLREPDVFKAAVAGAPVVDWYDYDTHYTERYLGVPGDPAASAAGSRDDPAYKEASLLTYAADLKRPLLVVHGTADDNVYFRHSLKLTDALFRAGKDFDILPLSGLTHLVPDPVVTQRLYGRIAGHFKKHLGNP